MLSLEQFNSQFTTQMEIWQNILILINAGVHVLFAGAVAQDAARLTNIAQKPALVSASTWAFATLLGGVITAAIYWFIHHSTITRPTTGEKKYDRI